MTSVKQITITSSLSNKGGSPSYTTIVSSSTFTSASTARSSPTGFFSNHGAVGGTFAAVGVVACVLLGLLAWLLVRKRRQHRMDADIVAATTAGAAATRQPFDDDDDDDFELDENPEMTQHGATSDPRYATATGSLLPQMGADQGAYGDSNAYNSTATTGPGYQSGQMVYSDGNQVPYGYDSYAMYGPVGAGGVAAGAGAVAGAGAGTDGSDPNPSQHSYHNSSAEGGYSTPSEFPNPYGQQSSFVNGQAAPHTYYGHVPTGSYSLPPDAHAAQAYVDQQGSYSTHSTHVAPSSAHFSGFPGGAYPGAAAGHAGRPEADPEAHPSYSPPSQAPSPETISGGTTMAGMHGVHSDHHADDDSLIKSHALS